MTQLKYPCEKVSVLNGKATLTLPADTVTQINITDDGYWVHFGHKETQLINSNIGNFCSLGYVDTPEEYYEYPNYFVAAETSGGQIIDVGVTDVQFIEREENYPGTDYQTYVQNYTDLNQVLETACRYLEVTEP